MAHFLITLLGSCLTILWRRRQQCIAILIHSLHYLQSFHAPHRWA